MLVGADDHLRGAAHHVCREIQSQITRETGLDASVSERLNQHVDEGRSASRQRDDRCTLRNRKKETIHVVLGDLKYFAEIAKHLVHQDARLFVRVGSERVAADALEDTARSVGEETDDAASRRVDLIIKRTHRTHFVADLLNSDSAGN